MSASMHRPLFLLLISIAIFLSSPTTSNASLISFDLTLYDDPSALNVLGTGWITIDESDIVPGQETLFSSLTTPLSGEISFTTPNHGSTTIPIQTAPPFSYPTEALTINGNPGSRTFIFSNTSGAFVQFRQYYYSPMFSPNDDIAFYNDSSWDADNREPGSIPGPGPLPPSVISDQITGQFYVAIERSTIVPVTPTFFLLLSGLITGAGLKKRFQR